MPRIPSRQLTTWCAACGRAQPDEGLHDGRGGACAYCGCSPLPSHAYPAGSPFRPVPPVESQQRRIERLVAERRAAAGR